MPVKIFFCYAHEDEELLNKLKRHLKPFQRENLIETWHDRDITAGAEWEQEIHKQLNEADIILLLVSPSFMDSDYCYSIEMKRAIERHERHEAYVIPIILRPVFWKVELLTKLQALPSDAIPVIHQQWHSPDEAFLDVTHGIKKAIEEVLKPLVASAHTQDESHLAETLSGQLGRVEDIAVSSDGYIKVSFKKWLPEDFATLLFGTITIILVIVGLYRYFLFGDWVPFMAAWSVVSGYVGIPRIALLLPWRYRGLPLEQSRMNMPLKTFKKKSE